MAFTKIVAAGIGSTGTVTLENVVVTGSLNASSITGAASTATVRSDSLNVSGVSTFAGITTVTGSTLFAKQLNVSGVSTLGNTVVGGATTQLIVTGNARITGILTIGTSSITLDGNVNQVNVGTGVTIHHTNGVQVGGNTVHSTGLTINQLNATGIVTANSFRGDGSQLTGITAGATLATASGTDRIVLTNQTSGTMTSAETTGQLTYNSGTNTLGVGTTGTITVGNTLIRSTSIGIGTTNTAGRNAGINTAVGTIIYNSSISSLQYWDGTAWNIVNTTTSAVTGGTVLTTPTSYIHVYNSTNPFAVNIGSITVDAIIVGGGGGGGAYYGAGGGGAGGYRLISGIPVLRGTYTITVGGGGAAAGYNPSQPGGDGGASSVAFLTTYTADGGGGGAGYNGPSGGRPGGSGGGGQGTDNGVRGPGGTGNQPGGFTPSQGNPGGAGTGQPRGGGGGGAGGPGGPANGGDGVQLPSTYQFPGVPSQPGPSGSYWCAGGGGGADNGSGGNSPSVPSPYSGGGRAGSHPANGGGTAGATNSGGGGGAYGPGRPGTAGGSGFVLISYPINTY